MTDPNAQDYCDPPSFDIEACDHSFTFYPAGADRLAALLDHIACARNTLDAFYYMFQDDASGTKVRDALVAAAQSGVEVSLIIDDLGSDAPADFFDPLVAAGGRFTIFSARWGLRYLIRNHQKFVIADGKRVMTGGANVSDHYFDSPDRNGWCDLGVRIEGPVAERFGAWFALLEGWTSGKGSQLPRIRAMVRDWEPGAGPGPDTVQLLMGGPLVRRAHWAYRFKQDLANASRLDLVTAYFGPPASFRRLFARIARRGRARLITAGKSDVAASIGLARLYYKPLIRAGVAIHEFQPCKLHMKLLVVDHVSYFGSANLDRRSMRINVELMVRVEDRALAQRLRDFIDHLESASITADAQWYRANAGFFTRLRWRLLHWLSLADYRLARSASE